MKERWRYREASTDLVTPGLLSLDVPLAGSLGVRPLVGLGWGPLGGLRVGMTAFGGLVEGSAGR